MKEKGALPSFCVPRIPTYAMFVEMSGIHPMLPISPDPSGANRFAVPLVAASNETSRFPYAVISLLGVKKVKLSPGFFSKKRCFGLALAVDLAVDASSDVAA